MNSIDNLSQAHFLYRGNETTNDFTGFLREFQLDQVPGRAEIALTADTHYKLYVNGRFVNAGPAPFRLPIMRVDAYDLRKYLRVGLNHVFAIVRHIGCDVKYNCKGSPSFIAALQLGEETILSDASWKAFQLELWERNAPKISWALPPMECADLGAPSFTCLATYASEDYATDSPLDVSCEVPVQTRPAEGIVFQPRRVPNLRWEKPEVPHLKQVYRTNNEIYNLKDTPLRLDHETVEPLWDIEARAIFKATQPVLHRQRGEHGYALTYDTLRMTAGEFTLEIESTSHATVELGTSEFQMRGHPYLSRNTSYYVTRLKLVPGRNRYRLYAFTGFRYLYFLAKDFEGSLKISELVFHECYGDMPYQDKFDVGDRAMAGIYEISRRSIQLTTQASYYDCNTREHGNYWGDGIWVTDMVGHMTGDFSHMREMCIAMTGEYQALGTLNSSLYGMGRPMLDYCMIAVEMCRRYARYTADRKTVLTHLPTCQSIVADFSQARDAEGFVRLENLQKQKPQAYEGAITFLDHPGMGWHARTTTGINRDEPNAGLNLFYLQALQALKELGDWLGESTKKRDLEIASLSGLIRKKFFEPKLGLIADAVSSDGKPAGFSQIVNAMAVITGVLEGARAKSAMKAVCDIEQHPWVSQGTPYTYFYITEALGRLGLAELAFREIRARWLPMLEQGATTTWETFRTENHDSLNHAWSAPLPYFARRWLAGIQPLEPGYQSVSIRPAVALRDRAQFTAVLPQGPLSISWVGLPGECAKIEVNLPEGVKGLLCLNQKERVITSGLSVAEVDLRA